MEQINLDVAIERDIIIKTKKELKEYIENVLYTNIILKFDQKISIEECDISFKRLFSLEDKNLHLMNIKLLHNLNMYDAIEASTSVYFTTELFNSIVDSSINIEGMYKKVEHISFLYNNDKEY